MKPGITMKRHVVVKAVARKLLDPVGMFRRDIVAQPDHHIALGCLQHERVLRIGLRLGGSGNK